MAVSTSDSDPSRGGSKGSRANGDPASAGCFPDGSSPIERAIYHSDGLLVLDKPAGVPVHAGTGHELGVIETVRHWVSLNPGVIDTSPRKTIHVVNQLEREASGVLVLALTRHAARELKERDAESTREYIAVVTGDVPDSGTLTGKLRSRVGHEGRRMEQALASLDFYRIAGDERSSLVRITPHTRRSRQIRTLFARAGFAIAGDTEHGKPAPALKFRERYGVHRALLHLARLRLRMADGTLELEAPLPEDFAQVAREKGWELG